MPCREDLIWAELLFVSMTIVTSVFIARHNRLGLKDTLLAMIGMKKIDRTPLIIVLYVLSILLPVGLMARIIQTCPV